jgi:hypothetical protein
VKGSRDVVGAARKRATGTGAWRIMVVRERSGLYLRRASVADRGSRIADRAGGGGEAWSGVFAQRLLRGGASIRCGSGFAALIDGRCERSTRRRREDAGTAPSRAYVASALDGPSCLYW